MEKPVKQSIISGMATCFTVVSVALLSSNKPEFITAKLGGIDPTPLQISNFDTVLYIAYLVAGILSGIVSNGLGRRKILVIVGSAVAAITFILLVIVPWYGWVLLIRFVQGCFTVLAWQVLMTIILDVSTKANRGKLMGIYGIFMAAGMGAGPVIGGVIADIGTYMPYYVAALFNVGTLLVAFFLLKEPGELKQKPSLRDTFTTYKRHPEIIVPGIFNLIDRLHMGFKLAILPIFIKEILGLDPSLRGMVLGINALPFIILQYPIGKVSDKKGRFGMLIAGSIGFGITLSVIGYLGAFSLAALILLYILLGIFSGITGPPSSALLGDLVEKEDNAMAMGFFNMLGNIGIIIGPVFGGLLGTFSSYVLTFLVAGLIELGALGVCLLLARRFGILKIMFID